MSNEEIIFRNTAGIIKRGKGIAQGLLYCGKKYSTYGGCPCLNCDGQCGPDDGCPCPDCYYTLSYILYSTGEMVCPLCKFMLLRKNIFNLRLLRRLSNNSSINCNLCKNSYNQAYLPMMHCRKCNYNMCPNCAFSKIRLGNFIVRTCLIYWGFAGGEGILYCNNRYTNQNMCLCGSCGGVCGFNCPCPLCDTILGYNMYYNNMTCLRCPGRLLIKTILGQLQKYKLGYSKGFKCDNCLRVFQGKLFTPVYHCFRCDFDVCQFCAFNIIKDKKILYPYLPEGRNINNNFSIYGNNNTNSIYNSNININNGNININNSIYYNNKYNNTNYNYYNNNYNNNTNNNNFNRININNNIYNNNNYTNTNNVNNNIYNNNNYTNNNNTNNNNKNNQFSIFNNNPDNDNDSMALRNNNKNNVKNNNVEDKQKEKESNDKDEDEDDSKKCVICLEEDKCILLMPCKHVCCCEGCSNDVNKCPICRNKIESKIKIFL